MKPKHAPSLAWIASLTIACSLSASAAQFTWDSSASDGGIITNGNATWSAISALWTTDKGLTNTTWNNDGTSTANFTGGATMTLGAQFNANSILFNSGSGTLAINGTTQTLNLSGTAPTIYAGSTVNVDSLLSGSNGLIKDGNSLLAIRSNTSNSAFIGGLTVNSGTLELSLANMANGGTDLVNSSNTLTLNSASAFRLRAKTSGVSGSQTLGAVTLNGASSININGSTGVATTLTLGAFDRKAGAAVNFATTTTGTNVFNAPIGTNFGNWATIAPVNLAGSGILNYASVDGSGKVIARAATAAANLSGLVDTGGTVDYDLADTVNGAVGANLSANSIRYTGTAAGILGGASNFTVNSLMNGSGTSGALWTIGSAANSGTITIGSGNELVVHPGKYGITINSKITGTGGVTINGVYAGGGSGTFSLASTTSDYTGTTTINGGLGSGSVPGDSAATITLTSALGNATAVGNLGKGGDIALNGAVIKTSGTTQTTTRNFSIGGVGGFHTQGGTLTIDGSISGTGNLYVDSNAGGGLTLGGNNSISGEVQFVTDGKLTLAHADALKNATLNWSGQRIAVVLSGDNAFKIGGLKGNGGDLALGTGLGNGGNGMISIGSNNQSNAFFGSLSGSAGLIKKGSGTQTLVKAGYTGDTVVEAGTLKLGTASALSFSNATVGNDSLYSKSRLTIPGAGSVAGLAVGQSVTIGINTYQIIALGNDTTNSFITLDATITSPATGTVAALNGSIASTTIEVKSGAFLDVTDINGFTLDASQTLKGTGTILGDITVAGELAPGASPGILTVDGNLTLGGTLSLELNGTTAGVDGYDQVALTGDGILGGTLSLAWNLLSAPAAGTELVLIDNQGTNSLTGAFSNAADGSSWMDNLGGTWSLNYAGGSGNDLSLLSAGPATVPEPSAALLGGLGLLALLRRRRK